MIENDKVDIWILEQKFKMWNVWALENGASANPDMVSVNPFSRYDWSGEVVSLDETDADPVPEDSLYKLLVAGETPERWDGEVSGIALINDGRWIAWSTFYGPTGHGFCNDAYGGNATIFVASSPETLRQMALGAEGRMLCGIPYQDELPPK